MAFVQLLIFSLLLQGTLGEFVCEQLPLGLCSFSIESSGKRCLLETYVSEDGTNEYQCKTSEVVANNMSEWIENEECISSCGVGRNSVGISSDSLLDPHFTARVCSPECYQNCPNIVDLYYNLAQGEGAYLPDICKAQQLDPRRALTQLSSSGIASGPVSVTAESPIAASVSSELPASVACAPTSI